VSAAPASDPSPARLDDVMLAMDVVDTVRHHQLVVEQELASGDRDAAMMERLRSIYAGQGLEVPDHVLAAGVAALRENRFAYAPPPDSWAVRLARLYVHRRRWALAVLGLVLVAALAWSGYRAAVVAPREGLRAEAESTYARILDVARVEEARTLAAEAYADAQRSLAAGELAQARDAVAAMEGLQSQLELRYDLEIVSGPDETTGVWRVPDVNPDARNHYLIVEAIGPDGRTLARPIRNEETGEVETVRRWGLRVDEATFERVAADKLDDGIVQDRLFGEKRAGELEVTYRFPTTGEAITSW
jgi:hypothetical protein